MLTIEEIALKFLTERPKAARELVPDLDWHAEFNADGSRNIDFTENFACYLHDALHNSADNYYEWTRETDWDVFCAFVSGSHGVIGYLHLNMMMSGISSNHVSRQAILITTLAKDSKMERNFENTSAGNQSNKQYRQKGADQ